MNKFRHIFDTDQDFKQHFRKLKVLPLRPWMKNPSKRLETVEPNIGRDGYYLFGDACWFEVNGKAYVYEGRLFNIELARGDTIWGYTMRECEYEAMCVLRAGNLLNKKQRNMLHEYEVNQGVREIHRRNKLLRIKLLKSVKNKTKIFKLEMISLSCYNIYII